MINFKYAKKFCNEDISLIENYENAIADQNQTWHCHHRRELETSRKELIKIGEYYNRPANELIFLTQKEHRALHNTLAFKGKTTWMKGKHHTEEAKQKISIANKGQTPWNKGKHHSAETKRKMAIANKGKHHSNEAKQKISEYVKMCHWFNNGIKNVFVKECPEGFVRGMLKRKAI